MKLFIVNKEYVTKRFECNDFDLGLHVLILYLLHDAVNRRSNRCSAEYLHKNPTRLAPRTQLDHICAPSTPCAGSIKVISSVNILIILLTHFIALIHPIQWTIAYPVSADRPVKRQKKTSCVSTGRSVRSTSALARWRVVLPSCLDSMTS